MSDVYLPMQCSCGEDGFAACEALYERVRAELRCDPKDFVTNIVISLSWDFGAYITAIQNDMWSAVYVKKDEFFDRDKIEDHEPIEIRCECDDIESGLAAIWEYLNHEFPRPS